MKAANLEDFVAQRGGKDCLIATVATAIGRSYEEVADAMGLPLDAGKYVGEELNSLDAHYGLLKLGWLAVPLLAKEKVEASLPALPTRKEILKAIEGRPAIIGYNDPDPNVGDHALAWDGKRAIDCSNGTEISVEGLDFTSATLLSPDEGR